MSNNTKKKINFPVVKCRKVTVEFSGGFISSDAGGLLGMAQNRVTIHNQMLA